VELVEIGEVLVPKLVFDIIDSDTLIEAPPGFKYVAFELAKKTGARVSGRPIWGSCDTADVSGNVVHLGHGVPPNISARLIRNLGGSIDKIDVDTYVLKRTNGKTYFVPVYYRVPSLTLPNDLPNGSPIYFPVPYRLIAEEIAEKLGGELVEPPMTGCWVAKPPSDVNVVVAAGYFYPLTLKLLKPNAKVYGFDPFSQRVLDVDLRFVELARLKAGTWLVDRGSKAIIISTKPGQMVDGELVRELSKRLNAVVVAVDEASPELLNDMPVDVVINAACPRIGFDDLDRVSKPVLNLGEVLHGFDLVNVLKWPL